MLRPLSHRASAHMVTVRAARTSVAAYAPIQIECSLINSGTPTPHPKLNPPSSLIGLAMAAWIWKRFRTDSSKRGAARANPLRR